jgi:hypothetical protein
METQTVTSDAAALIRVLQNTGLFASNDVTLPMLCCLHLHAADGTLTVEATDRYVLAQETIPDSPGALDVLVNAKETLTAVKPFLTALKNPALRGLAKQPTITVTIDGIYARFTITGHLAPDLSVTVPLAEGEYVQNTSSKFDVFEDTEITGRVFTFTTANLASLAKVSDGEAARYRRVEFTLTSNGKPAIVRIGEHFRAMVMTVRNAT